MFCKHCGGKLEEGAKFCGSCGKGVDTLAAGATVTIPPLANTVKVAVGATKPKTVLEKIIYWVVFILSFLAVRYGGWILFVIFLLAYGIGAWFPTWYLKRDRTSQTLMDWIAWSNLLTWLLPPLGIMTAIATLGLSDSPNASRKKYMTLAIIAIVLAIFNAIWGAVNGLSTQ